MKNKICTIFVDWFDSNNRKNSFASEDPYHVGLIVGDILKYMDCVSIDVFVPKDCSFCPVESCCKEFGDDI